MSTITFKKDVNDYTRKTRPDQKEQEWEILSSSGSQSRTLRASQG
jgi:hypothetical protein